MGRAHKHLPRMQRVYWSLQPLDHACGLVVVQDASPQTGLEASSLLSSDLLIHQSSTCSLHPLKVATMDYGLLL